MVKEYRELIKSYFNEHPLGSENIGSFNNFIEFELQKIVDGIGDIAPTIIPQNVKSFIVKFKKISIGTPSIIEADGSKRDITPCEARLRKLTYSAPLFLEIGVYIDGVQRESFKCFVGKLPIMVKSKYCHLCNLKREELIAKGEDPDYPGGYFIINGNERVLIILEDLAPNRLFIEKNDAGDYIGKVFSEGGLYRIPHLIDCTKDGLFYLSFTRFKKVPIIAVIKALGLIRDQDIMNAMTEEEDDRVYVNLYEVSDLRKETDALIYLAGKSGISQDKEVKIDACYDQLDKYLLPHIGTTPNERLAKAYNLCKYIGKLLRVTKGQIQSDDKDHYMNKRLRLSGDLLSDLMRVNLRALVQDITYNFQRLVKRGKFQSIKIIIRDELLTSNIKSPLATGSWTAGRKGISQNIDRTNILATMSHLQRVVSLLSSTQQNFEARALHPTHWGKLCAVETPEGQSIGLRKNLALLCSITQGDISEEKVKKVLEVCGLKDKK